MSLTRIPPIPTYTGNDPTLKTLVEGLNAYTDYLGTLREEVRSVQLQPGAGTTMHRTRKGTTIHAQSSARSVATLYPFDGYWKATSGGSFQLSRLGSVNGMAATNSYDGGGRLFSGVVGDESWIRAKIYASGGIVTGWEYNISNIPSPPISEEAESPPSEFYVDIGVCINNRFLKITANKGILVTPVVSRTTDKATIECGTYPFVQWYTWEAS